MYLEPIERDPMKHLFCIGLFLWMAPVLLAQPAIDPWPQQLVGRWEGDLGIGRYVEEWTRLDEHTFDGTATMYRDGKPVNTERTRLMYFADHWIYLAATGGPHITSFVRVAQENDTWIFENQEHDFPKRIGYSIKGDSLVAWIDDGEEGGKRMDFHLKRTE